MSHRIVSTLPLPLGALTALSLVLLSAGCTPTSPEEQTDEEQTGEAVEALLSCNNHGAPVTGDCASYGASITALTINTPSVSGSTLSASGSWTVAGAGGVTTEYFLDGTLQQTDTLVDTVTGCAGGAWSVPLTFGGACGVAHTFQVCATPRIGSGTTCPGARQCATRSFSRPCPPRVVADYDGDRKTDFTVRRPSAAKFYTVRSSDGQVVEVVSGAAADVPVDGDFDGDGKADWALWRPSNGNWDILQSSNNTHVTRLWGTAGDIPLSGDFDGDGKTDLSLWRPSQTKWYTVRSSDGQVAGGVAFGAATDTPMNGDFDGDGKADWALWRPSTGVWDVLRSSDNTHVTRQWGTGGDLPLPLSAAGGGGACAPGFADCDGNLLNGCEVDLSQPASCGVCGNSCSSGVCGTSIAASMASLPASWSFNGSAFHDAAAHSGVLTQAVGGSAGTIVYKAPIKTDSFALSFEIKAGGGTGADGFGFMLETNGPSAVGYSGEWVGIGGLDGYGLAVQMFNLGNGRMRVWKLDGPVITVLTPSGNLPNLPVNVRNGAWHLEEVQLSNGTLTAKVDGQIVIDSYALPGFVSGGSYHYGFGGGTGWLTDRHEIRNVLVTFPSPRCLAANPLAEAPPISAED
jgi:hypothetical protein